MNNFYISLSVFLCLLFSNAISQETREIHKVIPLKSDGRLIIDTYKGSISIATHEKPEVEVTVKIESDDADSDNPERDVKDTEIQIDSRDNEVSVRTDYKNVERHHHRDFWDWFPEPFGSSYSLPLVHYTILMPRTAELKIKDHKSKIRVEDLHAFLRINTYKGEVEIDSIFGGIDLETYKGTAHLLFTQISSDSRIETYKGKVVVVIPKNNGFALETDFEKHVDFNTDFDVQTIERGKKHHRYYNYRGNVNGGGSILELKSEKGDIWLRAQ